MIGDHGSDLLSHNVAFIRQTNLLHGFARLCCSLSELHKGMLGRVSGWIFSPAHREFMQKSMVGNGEVNTVERKFELAPIKKREGA